MNRNYISYIILILLITVMSLQFSSWGIRFEVYNSIKQIIIGGIIMLYLVSFKNPLTYYSKIPILKVHTVCLIIFAVILLILFSLDKKINFDPARDLTLALLVLMIGLNITLKEKQFIRLINIYIVLYTIAALSIVYTYAQGFVIHEIYLPIPKNHLSPAYGVAIILSLYFSFNKKGNSKWFYIIFIIFLSAALLVIRGRAAIVAVSITIFIFTFFYLHGRKYRFLIIVIGISVVPLVGQYIYDALFLNYDISDLNSISAGRNERNLQGVDFLINHPLFGELESPFKGQIIHNYILGSLVSYGILLSSLILIIYFKYVFIVINAIRKNTFQYYNVGPLLMIVLLVISLFEYTYPYAPGSAIFFTFFLMGQHLQNKASKN